MASKIDTQHGKRTPPRSYVGHVRVCFYNGDDTRYYEKWVPVSAGEGVTRAQWVPISQDEYHAMLEKIRSEQ